MRARSISRMQTVILLRGINLGPANRLPMADLRGALDNAGIAEPRTLLQSGNVIVDWDGEQEELEQLAAATIERRFGLRIPVLIRSASDLRAVVEGNPFGRQAISEPKRLQVTFLAAAPDPAGVSAAEAAIKPGELLHAQGRELYTFHPQGIADSKLALALTGRALGVQATSRNWTTVTKLLTMASDVA